MPCCLFGTKPLSYSVLSYHQLDPILLHLSEFLQENLEFQPFCWGFKVPFIYFQPQVTLEFSEEFAVLQSALHYANKVQWNLLKRPVVLIER